MKKIKVGVIGAAGYTGGELLRVLIHHPAVEIEFIKSESNSGKPVIDIHADLIGETDLSFSADHRYNIDVLFLCSGHGQSKQFLEQNSIPDGVKVIDLSHDFRPRGNDLGFIYGLPEINKEQIKQAQRIANPGCFATCLQLGLLPLASKQLLKEVHIHAITGSTGAGQRPTEFTHFSWRNNNISVYKAFQHQHLNEITESVQSLQNDFEQPINFIPVRGDFTRGIFASMYLNFEGTLEEATSIYESFYSGSPFVFVSKTNPSLKQVVNTNKGIVYLEKQGEKLLIISMIDNLLKGASGQAVQNMNLMFGLEEGLGLKLKASTF
ncbi:MAG: N-acetyl-gamma-glutamyl-phosphate reductase [Bacteroidota bacterium]